MAKKPLLYDDMHEIVICKHCGKPEYYGDMHWLSGWCGCRSCYKANWETTNHRLYEWHDLDGPVPTVEEYNTQEENRRKEQWQ